MRRYLSGIGLTLRQSDVEPMEKKGGGGKKKGEKLAAARVEGLVNLLKAHPGHLPLWIGLELEDGPGAPARVWVRPESSLSVKPVPELFKGLREILPPGRVRVMAQGVQSHQPAEPVWKRKAKARA